MPEVFEYHPPEKGVLEEYADEYAHSVFQPLYDTDCFLLDWLQDNENAWYAYLLILGQRWKLPPDEDQEMVKADIEKFVPVAPI